VNKNTSPQLMGKEITRIQCEDDHIVTCLDELSCLFNGICT
jgi:hypothetical protein